MLYLNVLMLIVDIFFKQSNAKVYLVDNYRYGIFAFIMVVCVAVFAKLLC